LEFFENKKAQTISADKITSELLETKKIQSKLIKKFGKTAVKHNKANKEFIAKKVFTDEKNRIWLENFLHPLIIEEIENRIKKAKQKIIVVEAPLLFESKIENLFDLIICIYASQRNQIQRAKKRGYAKKEFLQREKNQIDLNKKALLSDIIIINDTSIKDLKKKIENLYKIFDKNLSQR